ncbi:MAG TPA: hypothetical protein VLT61_03505 [Anaeromyxobacteraceae bacterium]|nr:hypothetical protein [Anaeromyxobacteraceae bacterium]
MSKQLYTVKIETEIVVLAESDAEAECFARFEPIDGVPDVRASPMRHIPGRWDRKSLVYGADGDVELGTLIDQGLAPEMAALTERIRAAKAGGR